MLLKEMSLIFKKKKKKPGRKSIHDLSAQGHTPAGGGGQHSHQAGSRWGPISTQGAGRRDQCSDVGDRCLCGAHRLHPLLRTWPLSPCSHLYIRTYTENLQVNERTLTVIAISLLTDASVLLTLSKRPAGDSVCVTRGFAVGRSAPSSVCCTVWIARQSQLFVKGNNLTWYKELVSSIKDGKFK